MNFSANITVTGSTLPVMESFYTLQGEGAYQGHASWFIRLGGCDVGCVWCDVKDSWDAAKHPLQTVTDIVKEAATYPGRLAVITGGEPLLHDCSPLTEALQEAGFRTHIETSGSSPLSGSWNWICVSPKKFKAPLPEVLAQADELKVVIYNKHDFAWAEQHAALVPPACRLFLQPEWSRKDDITPQIVAYILEHPQWTLSAQVHKFINVP
jgi:7-carboxy-7-deazaguanine synthase